MAATSQGGTLTSGHVSSSVGGGTTSAESDGSTGASTTSATTEPEASDTTGEMGISVDGHELLVDGVPYRIQGVCWNPVPRGGTHPADLDYAGSVALDAALMAAAGINTVRTYEPLTDRAVLDTLWAAGIRVINTVYPYGGNEASSARAPVAAVKDHPAILMWAIGNEWNYNGLYVELPHDQALARVNEVAAIVRAEDETHPITTIYGELPSDATLAAMPDIDVWGLNVYRGLTFGDLIDVWASRSDRPMFLAEYGADAWNATIGMEDPEAQAEAARTLTTALLDPRVLGGTIFEWSDEWWKDGHGSPDEHDIGGVAPGGGPHPDLTFNEEWWGIVDIDRNPRLAYHALAEVWGAP